eukprot:tig00021070_g17925.t1
MQAFATPAPVSARSDLHSSFAGERVHRSRLARPTSALRKHKQNRATPAVSPVASADLNVLFEPLKIDEKLILRNRIAMAPMTRCMAGEGLVPTEDMAAYYARRAETGLLITEATIVRPDGQGYPGTPGMFTEEQVKGWKLVTDRVHDNGGTIFCQLWHCGRVAHSAFTGQAPVAPSAVALDGRVPRTELQYETPRALEEAEVPGQVDSWRQAAEMAAAAGFDGVEIHGANGYFVDQFLHRHTNRREDSYGGTPEKQARFAIDVLDACIRGFGKATRVGIRLSPGDEYQMEHTPGDEKAFEAVLSEASKRGLAYVHTSVTEAGKGFEHLGGSTVEEFMRRTYKGTLVGVGNYGPESGAAAVAAGRVDLVAIGRPLIANPEAGIF